MMFKAWLQDESGQALSEYGLLVAVIAVGVIVAIGVFRGKLITAFDSAGTSLGNQSDVVGKQAVQP